MTTLLTPAQLAALPLPSVVEISAELAARLDSFCTTNFAGAAEFYGGNQDGADLVGGLFGLFYSGDVGEPRVSAARDLLRHFGYEVAKASISDVLAAMNAICATKWHSEDYLRQTLYGTAVALAAGEPFAAITMLDGPEGAGVGRVLTVQDLEAKIAKQPLSWRTGRSRALIFPSMNELLPQVGSGIQPYSVDDPNLKDALYDHLAVGACLQGTESALADLQAHLPAFVALN